MRDRSLAVLFVVAAGTVSGGCFDSTTVLRVGGTGAGTLQQRTIVKKAALAQLRSFGGAGGGRASLDPLSENQARALASSLGPGVVLVSSTVINNADGEGRESTYSFPDVSQLHRGRTEEPPPQRPRAMRRGGGNCKTASPVTKRANSSGSCSTTRTW